MRVRVEAAHRPIRSDPPAAREPGPPATVADQPKPVRPGEPHIAEALNVTEFAVTRGPLQAVVPNNLVTHDLLRSGIRGHAGGGWGRFDDLARHAGTWGLHKETERAAGVVDAVTRARRLCSRARSGAGAEYELLGRGVAGGRNARGWLSPLHAVDDLCSLALGAVMSIARSCSWWRCCNGAWRTGKSSLVRKGPRGAGGARLSQPELERRGRL